MILLDCYCPLTCKKCFFSFFVSNFTINFEMLLKILSLYFSSCYRPVLLFLCNFVCSSSFLLFHLQSFYVYKEKGCGQRNLLGSLPQAPFSFFKPRGHGLPGFFRLEPPLLRLISGGDDSKSKHLFGGLVYI